MPSSVETQMATAQSCQLGTPISANQLRRSSLSLVALVKETTVQEVQSCTSNTSASTVSSRQSPEPDQGYAGVVAADKELEAQASTPVRSSPPQPQQLQLEERQQRAQDQELEEPPAVPASPRGTSKASDAGGCSAPQTVTTPDANAIKTAIHTERAPTSGKAKHKPQGQRDGGGKDTNNIQGRGAEDGTARGPHKGPLTRMLRKINMGFFSRKKKDADANPYAKDVPYSNPMTPYQQARNNVAQGKSVTQPNADTPPPAYQSPSTSSGGFGDEKYGNQGGYGANRYGSGGSGDPTQSSGGYGGFDADAGRNDLFGGAASRPAAGQLNSQGPAATAGDNKNPALFGNAQDRYTPYNSSQPPVDPGAAEDEYGGYGAARELTEEEREEQEIQSTKNEIKAVRQAGLESLDRSIAIGEAGLDQMFGTRMRIAAQEERLQNVERNLDMATIHAKDGSDKTKTLDKLNRTPFFIPVSAGKKGRAKEIEATMQRHQEEKEMREQTRREGFADQQRMEETTKMLMRDSPEPRQLGLNKPMNSKFAFEEDDEDIEKEEAIQDKLKQVERLTGKMRTAAEMTSEDMTRSIKRLERIEDKTDRVDNTVRKNRAMLSQIR